ncbi:hypothetical protein [Herbaspirillum huttiense]|uniref:hypothetical protein n=1 Tax=Herbaspirillum huttiense TaxID=863372 RepID=UPI003F3FB013
MERLDETRCIARVRVMQIDNSVYPRLDVILSSKFQNPPLPQRVFLYFGNYASFRSIRQYRCAIPCIPEEQCGWFKNQQKKPTLPQGDAMRVRGPVLTGGDADGE